MLRSIVVLVLFCTSIAGAHPMGNFSVNHYARLEVTPGSSSLLYVLDFAEIPSFELLQHWAIDGRDPATLQAKASSEASTWLGNLQITSDTKIARPIPISVRANIQDGAGGMPILRVALDARVALQPGLVTYEDRNYPGRTGWKEIVIRNAKTAEITAASHGNQDVSAELTAYPSDASVAPPQDLVASLTWRTALPLSGARRRLRDVPGHTATLEHAPAAFIEGQNAAIKPQPVHVTAPQFAAQQPIAPGTVIRGDFLSRLLRHREIGIWMILAGIGVAFGLGAMHALSPGHGKTLVAAYLVGSRGTVRHAVFLGITVTATHTISVFLLGLGVLFFEQYVVPDRIIPWLGAISGLSIVGIGIWLLYQRTKALLPSPREHVGHSHTHDHDHHHHGHESVVHLHSHDGVHLHAHHHDEAHVHLHEHVHPHAHGTHTHSHDGLAPHSHVPEGNITLGSLIGLGISGGLVPCPSALVLMLSAVALGRAGLGLILLVGFSAGLAVVLTGIGMLVVYAKHIIPSQNRLARHPFFRLVPVFSSVAVILIGLGMTAISLGWVQFGRTLI